MTKGLLSQPLDISSSNPAYPWIIRNDRSQFFGDYSHFQNPGHIAPLLKAMLRIATITYDHVGAVVREPRLLEPLSG